MPPINQILPRLQKENNPAKEEHKNAVTNKPAKAELKNPIIPKPTKVDHKNPVVQNPTKVILKEPSLLIHHPRLSIEIDVTSNKNLVKMPDDKTDTNNKSKLNVAMNDMNEDLLENNRLSSHPVVEKGGGTKEIPAYHHIRVKDDDYRSPLDAFGSTT